jgi:hypothetical protein
MTNSLKERAEAGELNVMEDVSIWVHQAGHPGDFTIEQLRNSLSNQVLMNTTLNWMVDYAYAKEFVKACKKQHAKEHLPLEFRPF